MTNPIAAGGDRRKVQSPPSYCAMEPGAPNYYRRAGSVSEGHADSRKGVADRRVASYREWVDGWIASAERFRRIGVGPVMTQDEIDWRGEQVRDLLAALRHPPAMGGEAKRDFDAWTFGTVPVDSSKVASAPTCACRGGLSNPRIVHGKVSCVEPVLPSPVASGPSESISPVTFIGGVLNEPKPPVLTEDEKAKIRTVADAARAKVASGGDAGRSMTAEEREAYRELKARFYRSFVPTATVEELERKIVDALHAAANVSDLDHQQIRAVAFHAALAVGAGTTTLGKGDICKSHGKAVLVCHVDDGHACKDYLHANLAPPTFGEGAIRAMEDEFARQRHGGDTPYRAIQAILQAAVDAERRP